MANDPAAHDAAADAALIAALCAVDPVGLGGVVLRGYAGPAREAWLDHAKRLLPADSPLKRLPHGISDHRLLGGLDLTASLARGAPVLQKGVLAEADCGTLVIAMAERLPGGVAARIVAAMDRGAVALAREGFSAEHPTRFGVIALDEGLDDDEIPPPALLDRLAFRIDLGRLGRDEPLASTWEEMSRRHAQDSAISRSPKTSSKPCAKLRRHSASIRCGRFGLR